MDKTTEGYKIIKSICLGYIVVLVALIAILSGYIIKNINDYSNRQVDVANNYEIYIEDAITN